MWFEQLASNNQLSLKIGMHEGIVGKAIFDLDGTRRYFLEKRWGDGENILTAVMMNPSNASHSQSDATVDQLIEIAKNQFGYDGLHVVNVSSIINGTSNKLTNKQFAYNPVNWMFINGAILYGRVTFLGWGIKGQLGIHKQIDSHAEVRDVFKNAFEKLYTYEVLKSNDQRYLKKPLYYTPHPRPQLEKEKYRTHSIQPITDLEFTQIFVR